MQNKSTILQLFFFLPLLLLLLAFPAARACFDTGRPCTSNADCCGTIIHDGTIVIETICKEIAPDTGLCMYCSPVGMQCKSDDECCSGTSCWEGYCEACAYQVGASCDTPDDCCGDELGCNAGKCSKCEEQVGAFCTEDSNCCGDMMCSFDMECVEA